MSKRSASIEDETQAKSKRNKTSPSRTKSEMLTSQPTKRILVIGLAGHAPGRSTLPSAKLPKGQFRKMLQNTITEAKASGLELEMMQVKASSFPSALENIKEKLHSKPDGLLIGNGIRGTPKYTIFFEDLVNVCREVTPGTRMAFNTSPNDILECCLRNFRK